MCVLTMSVLINSVRDCLLLHVEIFISSNDKTGI